MKSDRMTIILSALVPQIIDCIVEALNIDEIEAIKDFYASKVYAALEKEDLWVWHFGPLTLANMFLQEKNSGSFDFPEEM